jgi:type I restriction enzyme M protein
LPPKAKGDTAFLQHMVETCDERGMVGVVMPHGVLFRSASEGRIRRALLEEDLFEAVIGLPPKLFFGTGIPAAILILNKSKPDERKQKVLFIDASGEGHFGEGVNQNRLRHEDILRIASVHRAFGDPRIAARFAGEIAGTWIASTVEHKRRQLRKAGDDPEARERIEQEADDRIKSYEEASRRVSAWLDADTFGPRFANVVSLKEVAENDFNLNISRYLGGEAEAPEVNIVEELAKLKELQARRDRAEEAVNTILKELGYE